jgi:hypothetical protein
MRPRETCGEWEALILLQRTARRRRCGKNKIRLYRTSFRGGLEEVGVRRYAVSQGVDGSMAMGSSRMLCGRSGGGNINGSSCGEWVKGQYVCDKLHSSASADLASKQQQT